MTRLREPSAARWSVPRLSVSLWLVVGLLLAHAAGAWPNLRISKSGPAEAAPGDIITYTLSYSNVGPVKSTSVVLKDFLPPHVTPLTDALNGGTLSGTTISWSLGTLNSNAKGSRSFQVRLNTNAPSGTITNLAQIFGKEAEEKGKTNDNYAKWITAIINVNHAPSAANDSYSAAEDTPLAVPMPGVLANDTDADGDALTAILVSSPTNGVLALNANGGFTYMPNTNFTGLDYFTYRAHDGEASSGVALVCITVLPVNDRPVARDDQYATPEDTVLTITPPGVLSNDSDPDGGALTALIVAAAANGQVSLNANGGFSYTPEANFTGVDSFTYRASDGGTNSATATVTITVTPANDPPVARDDHYATPEDTALVVNVPGVLGNDSDPENQTLSAVIATAPANGVLTFNADGSFSYVPNTNFTGGDAFTYRASDGMTNSGLATVTITVVGANDPPIAVDDLYATLEDVALTVPAPGVLTNDSDPDGDSLATSLVSPPSNGVLTFNSDGSFAYAPNTNYHGTDTFTYRAEDGLTNSAVATVTIRVIDTRVGTNDPPMALDDQYATPEDTALVVAVPGVLANDSDPDADPLSAVLVSSPAQGSLGLNTDGSFTYLPNTNFAGVDTFTYRASDGDTNSNLATVTITVTPTNDAPVARHDSYSVAEDTVLEITAPGVLANDTEPDGDAMTAVLAGNPASGTLTFNSAGSFNYTPNTNFTGIDTFTYRSTDGVATSEVATVTITVTPANDAPVARDDHYTTAEDTVLVVTPPGILANDTDSDGDILTPVLASAPTNGSLTLNSNGSFSYTPNTNFFGLDSFTYRANDGQLDSALATVNLEVTPVYDPPDTNNWGGKSFTLLEDSVLSVAPPGVLRGILDVNGRLLRAALVRAITNGTLSVAADGSFSLAPLTNFNGTDGFQFAVEDDDSNSVVLNVDITVLPVNDPPSFMRGESFRLPQNAGAQVILNWATQISPGPANESSQTVTFEVSNDNPALFTVPPAIGVGGALSFTPAPGASGLATVTVVARDDGGTAEGGVDVSAPQTFTISLNTPPTVQIVSPTNGAAFFAPGDFTLLADAQDVDGVVTNVQFFLGTNALAAVTNEPFFTVLTNLPVGSYTLGARATDDFGATATAAPVTVQVLERPPLTFLTSVYYNPQKDFFEQRVRVTNPTYSVLNAVRVLVYNLTNTPPITVANNTGFTNGIPYVQTAGAIPPGSYVDLTIEFHSPQRIMPNPILRAELVPPAGRSPLAPGTQQTFNRGLLLATRTFMLEFRTLTNRVYSIQYSSDLEEWKAAQPAIVGDGNWIQWIDNGEPKTDADPALVPARFYRLILLP